MIRIRHLVLAVAVFDLVMGLAFVVSDRAEAQTAVVCCIPATANNPPAPGDCFAPSKVAKCDESIAPGHIPCAGVFTGTANPARLSTTISGDAEGCVLVDGTINVTQVVRRCVGIGSNNCECKDVMKSMVPVSTKLASGLICP